MADPSSVVEDAVAPSVRALLDAARTTEATDIAAARSMAQQARVVARAAGDRAGEAEALYRLASIAFNIGQASDAFAIATEAKDMARECGAVVVEVWAFNLIGIVHYRAGNFSEALECALKALDLYRTSDHRVDEGNLLNTIAVIHHSLGDTDRALVTYEAAIAANKGLDRPENDALTLVNMAEVRAGRNENLLAVSLAESALELSRVHAPNLVPDILARLGNSYCALDSLDSAQRVLDEATRLIESRSDPAQEPLPETLLALAMARGNLARARGDLKSTLVEYESALTIAHLASDPEGEMKAHVELAAVHKELGHFEQALHHQEARFTMHEELFNRGTDLRIKTLQIAHDTEAARQQAEILRLRTGQLEAMVRGRTSDLEEFQLAAFHRLAVHAERRGTDNGDHTERVGDLAAELAAEIGEPAEWVRSIRLAGRLHDIGKVGLPERILLHTGPLEPEDFEVSKEHTTIGHAILSGSSSPTVQLAAEIALNHHERWDGAGYPNGLASGAIPLSGRLVRIADVFDSLTSERPYGPAWSVADAIRYVVEAQGTQFEPRLVAAFLRVMARRFPKLAEGLSPIAS